MKEEREFLGRPIEEEELRTAAFSMSKCDGLPIEFYTATWKWLGSDYHAMVLTTFSNQKFEDLFNYGAIVLLPKTGNQRKLDNKRGISLFNLSYKIYAKVLALRVVTDLQSLIDLARTLYIG